ncbi:hypothetical protein [Candidatus Spongiihabitans sp.]|uniref:hypothetical protein n=1 Tax=Candidatus Spongiihabitans sp. TaxID=3101308 RepID=UPI003C7CF622
MPGPYYYWPGNPVDNCHAQRDSLFPITFALPTRLCPLDSPLPPPTRHPRRQAEKIAGSTMNRLDASEASPKGAYQG